MINEIEKKHIVEDYENGLSLGDICRKYKIPSKTYVSKYILSGNTRSISEANKIAHKKYAESFKHSDETKQRMREKRLAWIKANPEKTAWRLKNMSYPEKCFQKILEDNGLDKQYLIYREYSVFPYFIDFAFIDEKIAIEIDGSQHLEEDRRKKDAEKDALLISNGWRIIRITATEVIHCRKNVLNSLMNVLSDNDAKYTKVGIFKAPKTREKVARGKDGLSDKERLRAFKQRRVERPTKEELFEMVKNKPFTVIGKEYGVSDKAIVKWCKYYDLPYRRKDIKSMPR